MHKRPPGKNVAVDERDELRSAVAAVKEELTDATAVNLQLAGERDVLRDLVL